MDNYGIAVTRLDSDCLTCILKKELDRIPEGTPEEKRLAYKQQVLSMMGRVHKTMSPSEISRDIQHLQMEMFGKQVDYPQIKSFFNKKMMEYLPKTVEAVRQAEDPLRRALQFSMGANYIDFGMPQGVTEDMLDAILTDSEQIEVSEDLLLEIREQLKEAQSVVFLHDNCGEIVMDKLLITEIRRQFPQAKITSVVRGAEVLNDVTMEDAEQAGLAEVASVISDGDDVAGTCLTRVSEECRDVMKHADVILSKGQGNFETLRGCGLNIYYIFLCKCELFRKRFQVPAYAGMIVHERDTADLL